jgi:hypothetical protein
MGTPTIHHHEDPSMLNYYTLNNIDHNISWSHFKHIEYSKKYNLVIQVKKKWKLETRVLKWLKDCFQTFPKHFYFILWNALVAKTIRRMHIKRWPSSKYFSSRVTFPRDNMSECCDPPIIWQCSIHYRKLMLQSAHPHNLYVGTNFKPTLLYVSNIAYLLSKKLNTTLCI